MYIYNADVYCVRCGRDIMRRLNGRPKGAKHRPSDDDITADSSEFPQPVAPSETDSPQHCGSGPDCVNSMTLSDGSKVGRFLECPLTAEGERYVREAHRDNRSEITEFWMDFYGLNK